MCGIAGLLCQSPLTEQTTASVLAALAHRGPDDSGVYRDAGLALIHTRLSIIDLAGGHQPLTAEEGRLVLVVNGEIYNHVELRAELEAAGYVFSTHSDSEVVLHGYRAWGEQVLARLNGMFALALWDARERRLLLARDRLGIKPLFLRHLPEGIAFASEMKALRALGGRPEVDARALAEYMAHQFSGCRRTLWRDTERVLPGEALVLTDNGIERRWRYWDAREIAPREIGLDAAIGEFDELFDQVLREHLRADVPIGLFLSGGVDSSVLLGRLSRLHAEPLQAYSVGFRDAGFRDELPIAEQTAAQFGVPLHAIRPSADDLMHALPQAIWAADELMRDFASLPTLMLAQGASVRHKVVFSGEGGDEVFGGYRRYAPNTLERWAKALLHPRTGGFRTSETVGSRQRARLYQPALQAAARHSRELFRAAWQTAPRAWSDVQRRQYVDLVTALPDNLLVKADRMLMRHGIEGRVPFLDHRVVEFGLALPDRLKVRNGSGKWFLKQWASRFLDRDLLTAKKRGFYVPFRQQFGRGALDRLTVSLPRQDGIREWFRPEGVRSLLAGDLRRGELGQTGFALLQFALWHRMFVVGDGAAPPARASPLDLLEAG